jgi:hypothetical protein
MEIQEFSRVASKINFVGPQLQRVSVSIDSWAPGTESNIRPLFIQPRYVVCYLYSTGEATGVVSGSGPSANQAITAAFAHWLSKGHGLDPAPNTQEVIPLKRLTQQQA